MRESQISDGTGKSFLKTRYGDRVSEPTSTHHVKAHYEGSRPSQWGSCWMETAVGNVL